MKKILVIEDDEFYRKMYQYKFEKSGFEVKTAVDGMAGLQVAREFQPDLILLDIVMPVMNGFGVIKQVKADPNLREIPIVMMTNLSSDADRNTALKAGAKDYWVKTDLTPAETVERVKQFIG